MNATEQQNRTRQGRRTRNEVVVPNDILRGNLSPTAKLIWCILAGCAEDATEWDNGALSAWLGASRKDVAATLVELRSAGLLVADGDEWTLKDEADNPNISDDGRAFWAVLWNHDDMIWTLSAMTKHTRFKSRTDVDRIVAELVSEGLLEKYETADGTAWTAKKGPA